MLECNPLVVPQDQGIYMWCFFSDMLVGLVIATKPYSYYVWKINADERIWTYFFNIQWSSFISLFILNGK